MSRMILLKIIQILEYWTIGKLKEMLFPPGLICFNAWLINKKFTYQIHGDARHWLAHYCSGYAKSQAKDPEHNAIYTLVSIL